MELLGIAHLPAGQRFAIQTSMSVGKSAWSKQSLSKLRHQIRNKFTAQQRRVNNNWESEKYIRYR